MNQKNMSRRKKNLIVILAVVAVAVLAGGGLLLSEHIERTFDKAPEGSGKALSRIGSGSADPHAAQAGGSEDTDIGEAAALYYNGKKYVYNEQLVTLLILGIDDNELQETDAPRNTSQADFLLVAVFDPETETCRLIQLNRDTVCDVPILDDRGNYAGMVTEQIALAHTYGNGKEKSCENTADAVSMLLYGISIDNYFSVTMDAIPVLNDLVGGVTVIVEDDFSGVDDTLVQGETVTLTGENVEAFVRSRRRMKDDPTNIARMRRQRTYMTGLFSSLRRTVSEDPGFVFEAYAAIDRSLVTDCSVNQLSAYADRFSQYDLYEIVTPKGTSVEGERYMEFYIDEEALQRLVIEAFYTEVG